MVILATQAWPLRAEEPVRNEPAKPALDPAEVQFFEAKIRPLLAANCFGCHGPEKQQGKLRLDAAESMLAGGESGPAVVPGKPAESLLVDAINYEGLEMPPKKRLKPAEVALLTEWVARGAPWPNSPSVRPAVAQKKQITAEDRGFWSFRPRTRPTPPAVNNSAANPNSAMANPIDAFVLAKLQAKQLALSPPAAPRELIRRVYFDLVGLPPSPEEVERFEADPSPQAYEAVVDRLLELPHYGERWGRHWLDLVRFAQTNGYERDSEKPHSWRYRDYVIKSFNEDKPYDQFLIEQLAGDELTPRTDDAIIATGYYRIGVWDDEPDDEEQAIFDGLDDIVSTTSSAMLGLTIGCARCHDHKFDPVLQQDYYGLLAFLRNVTYYGKIHGNAGGTSADPSVFTKLSSGEDALAVNERGSAAPETFILVRGDAHTKGPAVAPQFVTVLSDEAANVPAMPQPAAEQKTSGRRLALARWIASRDNPLTARVIVNRLWQHHFGQGIVATPSDFGATGTKPTHPELLDWLASELVDGGWRLKRMHKLMMLSQTYRQSSRATQQRGVDVDPDNQLLWRQRMRRLEAEAIRDAVLVTSGRFNPAMGGRGIFPTLAQEVLSTQSRPGDGWGKSSPEEESRRSIYIYAKRTLGVPLLETFDVATPDQPVAVRATTTIAPQALILLNSQFIDEQAAALAERLLKAAPDNPAGQVAQAFRLALARQPTAEEAETALTHIERHAAAEQAQTNPPDANTAHRRGLESFCKLMLNLNEFVYVD